jgi:hypothetical protein
MIAFEICTFVCLDNQPGICKAITCMNCPSPPFCITNIQLELCTQCDALLENELQQVVVLVENLLEGRWANCWEVPL